jgi:hypothetical protein
LNLSLPLPLIKAKGQISRLTYPKTGLTVLPIFYLTAQPSLPGRDYANRLDY